MESPVDGARIAVRPRTGRNLTTTRAACPHDPIDQFLLRELAELEADLAGYPVDQLLDVFTSAEAKDRATAFLLVDRCLASWIEQLQSPLHPVHVEWSDALESIQQRQRDAHDALMRVHAALSRSEVVLLNRGQLC